MIDLIAHFVASLLTGFFFWLIFSGKSKMILLWCLFFGLLAGFFVDLDHLFDYVMAYGFHWNFQLFVHEDYLNLPGYNYNFVLLHDFELVFLFGLIAAFLKNKEKRIFFGIMATSLFLHILVDVVIGSGGLINYFLVYRILTGFSTLM
jgi:hypothetical protein